MKRLLVILVLTVSLLNSCTKSSPSQNGGTNPPPTPTVQYHVGDLGPASGRIIHIDSSVNPRIYYECTPDTIGNLQWGCGGTNISYSTPNGLPSSTNGKQNTIDIVGQCSAISYAAKRCSDYSITVNSHVYDDWYLPSSTEFGWLFYSGHLPYNNYYWSSEQYGSSSAWGVKSFPLSSQQIPKSSLSLVIAMRSFQ